MKPTHRYPLYARVIVRNIGEGTIVGLVSRRTDAPRYAVDFAEGGSAVVHEDELDLAPPKIEPEPSIEDLAKELLRCIEQRSYTSASDPQWIVRAEKAIRSDAALPSVCDY